MIVVNFAFLQFRETLFDATTGRNQDACPFNLPFYPPSEKQGLQRTCNA